MEFVITFRRHHDPYHRPASAEEIAAAIVYLAFDDASFIAGAIVPVDGGRTAI